MKTEIHASLSLKDDEVGGIEAVSRRLAGKYTKGKVIEHRPAPGQRFRNVELPRGTVIQLGEATFDGLTGALARTQPQLAAKLHCQTAKSLVIKGNSIRQLHDFARTEGWLLPSARWNVKRFEIARHRITGRPETRAVTVLAEADAPVSLAECLESAAASGKATEVRIVTQDSLRCSARLTVRTAADLLSQLHALPYLAPDLLAHAPNRRWLGRFGVCATLEPDRIALESGGDLNGLRQLAYTLTVPLDWQLEWSAGGSESPRIVRAPCGASRLLHDLLAEFE